jgi:hypothetical protein
MREGRVYGYHADESQQILVTDSTLAGLLQVLRQCREERREPRDQLHVSHDPKLIGRYADYITAVTVGYS